MRRPKLVATCAVAGVVVAIITFSAGIHAFINPNFTPLHLMEQSDYVLILKFDRKIKDGTAVAKVAKILKGEAPSKSVTIDLMAGAFEAQGKAVGRIIASGNTHGLMFVGMFEEGDEGGEMGEDPRGMLNIGGKWINLLYFEENIWDLEKINARMLGTWAGGTDMLERCIEYIGKDPDADVPVRTEAELAKPIRLGNVAGKAACAMFFNLMEEGKSALFVPSSRGDRIFVQKGAGRGIVELTAKLKLSSKSVGAAWVNAEGKRGENLISFDGKSLKIYTQQDDGTFDGGAPLDLAKIEGTVRHFPKADGSKAHADLPAGTQAAPVLVSSKGADWNLTQFSAMPVDLAGDGKIALFIASVEGDRIFAYDKAENGFSDITRARGLATTSCVAAWGNFDGKVGADLVRSDGKSISVHLQKADGAFGSVVLKAPEGGVRGLSTLDGGKGRSRILVSTAGAPVLLSSADGNTWTARTLTGAEVQAKGFGEAAPCLVADFDGDAVADILQLFERGGLFYRGALGGEFAAPERTQIMLGRMPAAACCGDFDQDGLMDAFTTAADVNRVWHNLGKAKFVEKLARSGEIEYISKPGGTGCDVGDVNNDGRQDILITYPRMVTQTFFNRGFRSFGHSHMMDLADSKLLPEAEIGQQCGCFGDFNGDGAHDLALVLLRGDVHVFPRSATEDDPPLSLSVALETAGACSGPVQVSARVETRAFGAWPVRAGGPGAFFGMREAGPLIVTWQFPGEKPRKREVILEDEPVRLVIKPQK